jgi:hypothetical protein
LQQSPLPVGVDNFVSQRMDSSIPKLSLHKELLVALLVGGLFGPLIGWLGGMLAMFFASALIDETSGMRTSAFLGGLIGIPLGLLVGLVVGIPLRLLSARVFPFLKNVWLAAPLGAAIGSGCGFIFLLYWNTALVTIVYVGLHAMFVGGMVAVVSVLAKPKWL